MPPAPPLSISADARKHAVASLQQYLANNLEEEVGDLKATLLLDFIVSELGPTIYNQAIVDARAYFDERIADLSGVCYHPEFPSTVKRKR